MNEDKRDKTSAAENFLALIRKSRRGSFKVYIGMAAGVGKTYRMLSEAHDLLELGVDVIIGYVETHRRIETEEKLSGLPIIPRKKIFYKGRELEEMDIDAILARHPEVVVVDELAHSNVPGSRNQKRYEDVEEILNAGINVISALNIQHLESLAGIVEEATGVEIHERVPDSLLKLADEVVNIDLTADDLIKRLEDGKIYSREKVEVALNNFFQRDNLLKLRELALREVANQVERKIEIEVEQPEKKQIEKILVCISSNPERAKELIRKASRLADRLDAYWFVLYVETPDENPDKISLTLQRHLINNLQTATELGAVVQKIKGSNITETILQFAIEKEISRLVVGRPNQTFWTKLFKTDTLSKLLSKSEGLDIDIDIIA
ncbi:MAG: universal stress protein [Chloroherpetonaceae bacterium]|nr:universal stress protein [Chloroherpetonaceae bacterium]